MFCSLHTVLWNHGSSLTSWGSRKLTFAWTLERSLCDPHINLLTSSSLETETTQCARFRVIPYCTRRSRKACNLSFCTTFVWPTTRMSLKGNFTSCGQAPFDNHLNINLQKGMINVVSLRVSGSRSTKLMEPRVCRLNILLQVTALTSVIPAYFPWLTFGPSLFQ